MTHFGYCSSILDLGSLSLFVPSFLHLQGVLFYEVCQGVMTLHPKSGKREKMGPLDLGKPKSHLSWKSNMLSILQSDYPYCLTNTSI